MTAEPGTERGVVRVRHDWSGQPPHPTVPRPPDPHRRRAGSAAAVTGAPALAAAASITAGACLPVDRGLLYALPPLLVCIVVTARRLLARRLAAVTVRGRSMEPSYHDGDRVLVRRTGTPAAGEVVVVEQPGADGRWLGPPPASGADDARLSGRRWLIKRVAAVPGEPVPRADFPALAHAEEDAVPPGKVVLVGDNRRLSLDSRRIGYFPAERVLGVVVRGAHPAPGHRTAPERNAPRAAAQASRPGRAPHTTTSLHSRSRHTPRGKESP
ncbi:S26 family signal peptidase [Streptomyces sp. NBC_01268]|uniref:S26 family signal peptidase n=1 Tax=Streptomyces sp. NBC_01268 TaxID=2903806 RepID=UPI002E332115|nr:S26 family signal peptidase [Streptomyces sp. NBC_01268]